MVNVGVKVNVKETINALEKFRDVLDYEIQDTLEREILKVQAYARSIHRFRHKSGTLRTAIQSEVRKLVANTFIDDARAEYGKYVHEGHHIGRPGQWLPDRFLVNAVNDLKPEIMAGLDAALDRAKKRARL